jgi:hypothetical protein
MHFIVDHRLSPDEHAEHAELAPRPLWRAEALFQRVRNPSRGL